MSPLRHRSVFGAKSAQNGQLRKVRFFVSEVKCGAWASKFARSRSKSLDSVFCPEKHANSSPLSLSPFASALSPLAFGSQKCAKAAQFPSSGRRGPGSERDSPPRFRLVTRQPAELVTAFVTAPSGSVFGAKSAQNGQLRKVCFSCQTASGMPEPQVSFSVESRLQTLTLRIPLSARKTGEFHPAKLVTACHRFVTALFWAAKCAKAAKFPRGLLRWQV